MKLVSLIQPSVLVAIAVAVGVGLASRRAAFTGGRGRCKRRTCSGEIKATDPTGASVSGRPRRRRLPFWVFAEPMLPELAARAEA